MNQPTVPSAQKLEEKRRLEYFREHVLPLLSEAIKFRAQGVQFYIASQAFLFAAWANARHPAIILFGVASSIVFYIWDERSRGMMFMVHDIGRELADKPIFHNTAERKRFGLHHRLGSMLEESGALKRFRSFTFGIRMLVVTGLIAWGWIGVQAYLAWRHKH